MICRECPKGRRFAQGTVYCRFFGMYIRDDMKCVRSGGDDEARAAGGDQDPGEERNDGAAIPQDSAGTAGQVPQLLRGSGE